MSLKEFKKSIEIKRFLVLKNSLFEIKLKTTKNSF